MTDGDGDPQGIRQLVQFHLPQAHPLPIAAAAIGTDQQRLGLLREAAPHLGPPAANTGHGKTRRIMVAPDIDPPQIAAHLIAAIRDRLAQVGIGKVLDFDLLGLPLRLPFLAAIPLAPP